MRRLLIAVFVVLALARPAFAHVEVSPTSAPRGGAATFTFNVEDEQAKANELTVEIYLPDGVAASAVKPTAPVGWDFTFTASPGSVRFAHAAPGPDGDQSFTLAIDPLPDADQLVFKTVVEYDNGAVDRWIDLKTGSDEPPHPAAVVKLEAATAGTTTTTTQASRTPTTVTRPDKGSDSGAIVGFLAGVVVVTGLVIAFALRRGRGDAA